MEWTTVALAILGISSGLGAFWRFVLHPLLRMGTAAQSATPALLQMAHDFQNGHSLKRRIDQVDEHLARQDQRLDRIEVMVNRLPCEHR